MAQPLDVDIEYLDAAGDGVAHAGRQRLAVPFTIPGERVRVHPGPVGDGAAAAALDTVLGASPHRVTPRCPHFGPGAEPGVGPCGGCTWQHIAYPEQLRLKSELVTRLVRAAVPAAPAARPMLPGTAIDDPWGYRQKVHFVLGGTSAHLASGGRRPGRRGTLTMGHYVRGTRRVLPVRECAVHAEQGNALAFRLRDAYAAANVAAVPGGPLKSIAIRVGHGTPELMATLVVADDDDTRIRRATRKVLEQPGAPTSFHVNLHPRGDAFVFGRDTRRIAGSARMREHVGGASFLVSPTAFFQTNVQAAELLVQLVLAAIPAGARVLDLYAGAGLFALPLAGAGHQVLAVEEHRAAVADGEASLRLNRIPARRCRFLAQRVEQALVSPAARQPFDAVVLDPPREGCPAGVIDAVFGRLAPATAVYISCNPQALARDIAAITRHRYRVLSIQPVDMFPHTAHVECVVVLAR